MHSDEFEDQILQNIGILKTYTVAEGLALAYSLFSTLVSTHSNQEWAAAEEARRAKTAGTVKSFMAIGVNASNKSSECGV
jgi:hypothetical protein